MPQALVVDDAKVIRLLLASSLTDLGFEVSQAADGRKGLETAKKMQTPSVVLVDWNMPVMNGIDMVKSMRSDPDFADTKIVMVTSETEVSHIVAALEAGANDYIMKPFTTEMIEEKLLLLGLLRGQQV